MYEFKIGVSPAEHDAFVEKHPLCNLLQSSSWAKVKDNWGSEIVGVYQEGKLVASSLVLIRPLPAGFAFLYTPRGPIMDYTDKELVDFFMEQLKKFGKKKRAVFVKMDPTVIYKDILIDREERKNPEAQMIIDNITSSGAKYQGLTMEMSATIQPRFQANIYKEDFSEEQLSKSTKKMLKQAQKKGVVVRQGGKELVPAFAEMIKLTTERQQILLRSADYFEKLMDIYPEQSFIMLAEVDLKARYEETKTRHEKNKQDMANLKENQVKKRHNLEELEFSLTRELAELEESMKKSGDKAIVAGALAVTFGTTSEILYAGMDEHYKRYMPAYLTWFEAINECFERGCESCNMGGLEGSLNDGLIKFKSNFNPTINEFIGEFDLPANMLLFKLSEFAYKLKKGK
ncbi:aminoacyltransferase [Candidatus Enterococcus clewellii]|uniref:FemAB family protein n=1 Tax=Candidatus Enterococcus clewellii TaxID=1834193 RepID=A0A242K7J1_9ENTE|nr:aminoacyltransferase [Enterococcus sp. 9E7_DIV0242]OTP15895.1 FemAB family protein [Enterococcus sp. 9E7_DIV0242]